MARLKFRRVTSVESSVEERLEEVRRGSDRPMRVKTRTLVSVLLWALLATGWLTFPPWTFTAAVPRWPQAPVGTPLQERWSFQTQIRCVGQT